MTEKKIYLLDYGAGNIRSLANAVSYLGYTIETIQDPKQLDEVDSLIFPGVGSFGSAFENLEKKGYKEALKKYILDDKPFLGICVGMQSLFEGSDESPDAIGLGIIKGNVCRINSIQKPVPHIGWNTALNIYDYDDNLSKINHFGKDTNYYFVHSYAVPYNDNIKDWVYSVTRYGDELFVSSIRKGHIFATQFHPEKSGKAGLEVIRSFLDYVTEQKLNQSSKEISRVLLERNINNAQNAINNWNKESQTSGLTRRIIACMDVRSNDKGDLVVTKGDQYDVRERNTESEDVRNLGKPIELAKRYYEEGADEISFLNITAFRDIPLKDMPLLDMLREASKEIFVPVTIGGGIRDIKEPDGTIVKAVDVAAAYFRSGADKVCIGSDAVYAAEEYYKNNKKLLGTSSIEQIAHAYGSQAVVISVDPKRRYISNIEELPNPAFINNDNIKHTIIKTNKLGNNGEEYCWYEVTAKGGRESKGMDIVELIKACEALGAGEILMNSIDNDGQGTGFDQELIQLTKDSVKIPVIASSGAGSSQHFIDVFSAPVETDAALAAGIFHRNLVPISNVKQSLKTNNIIVRLH